MPFAPLEQPSLGLSLLSAIMKKKGCRTLVLYESLRFAEKTTLPVYTTVSANLINQLGEWAFAGAFAHPVSETGAYLRLLQSRACTLFLSHEIEYMGNQGLTEEFLNRLRSTANEYIQEAAARVLALKPSIVGCTSKFQQHNPSLALLKRIKRLQPGIVTILGGSICDGRPAVATALLAQWVDYVFTGEADETLPRFYELLRRHGPHIPSATLPEGIIDRSLAQRLKQSTSIAVPSISAVSNLDAVPYPDFDDFYEQVVPFLKRSGFPPILTFELARGCWWHNASGGCSFCSLTPRRALFRAKSAERARQEIEFLSKKYNNRYFMVMDDVLDKKHYSELLPKLNPLGCSFYLEIRAPVNETMVDALSQAGGRFLQVGIESLHTDALRLMNKGTTALDNIHLMKLCRERGIRLYWLILFGLPGEQPAWYDAMAKTIPLLVHLQPPYEYVRLRFERFSRYCIDPGAYGLRLSPHRVYRYAFPTAGEMLSDLAYYFEEESNVAHDYEPQPAHIRLGDSIAGWWGLFPPDSSGKGSPLLSHSELDDKTIVIDTRPCAVKREHVLTGATRMVHESCREPATLASIIEYKGAEKNEWEDGVIISALNYLVQSKIVMENNDRYLSLSTKEPVPLLPTLADLVQPVAPNR